MIPVQIFFELLFVQATAGEIRINRYNTICSDDQTASLFDLYCSRSRISRNGKCHIGKFILRAIGYNILFRNGRILCSDIFLAFFKSFSGRIGSNEVPITGKRRSADIRTSRRTFTSEKSLARQSSFAPRIGRKFV